ncbi:MBL fold metallo-hydrolase [Shinella oryzae]|uniref:MBL fold metallo-hydrolase n=1 Tax=Shinella oryzae TaxID=2871820 RepID=A0ABY9KB72_9HYPH|nr:MBL fold metallo-hydrolase [Shinella oryzae]WLS05235.1 MBL fold metallo-hydrolase [Shinella oryzae]
MTPVLNDEISLPNLFVTSPVDLPYMRGVVVRSFLIMGGGGTLAIYNAPGLSEAKDTIIETGVPRSLLMSHWNEAIYGAPDLEVKPYVQSADLDRTRRTIQNIRRFEEYLDNLPELEIIAAPGHTAGSTMFLWTCGSHRVLFSGDSIWNNGGRWEAVVLSESNREEYIGSLETVAELGFDVLIPWVAKSESPYVNVCERPTARKRILEIAQRLRNGQCA